MASEAVRIQVAEHLANPGTERGTAKGTFRATGAIEDSGSSVSRFIQRADGSYRATQAIRGSKGTLVLRWQGRASATGPTDSGRWRIASGTGRYAGLTGAGRLQGSWSPNAKTGGMDVKHTLRGEVR